MFHKKQILFIVFICHRLLVIGQGEPTIKATIDKSRILIGEPLKLTIEAAFPPGTVILFNLIDTIEHFEFLEKTVMDTSQSGQSTIIKAIYNLTSFDSGHWVIPVFSLTGSVNTDTIPVDVVFSEFDPGKEYHSIKDIIEMKPPGKRIGWWWYVAGGILVLAFVILYLLRKKKVLPPARTVISTDPYEEAIKQLEQLHSDKPEVKIYHSRLTDIFRLYIFRKKGILSLQKTTDDLIVQLKSLNLHKEQFDKLSQSLRLSDFVKFAKYIPSNDDNRNAFSEIRNAIVTIEKTEAKAPLLEHPDYFGKGAGGL